MLSGCVQVINTLREIVVRWKALFRAEAAVLCGLTSHTHRHTHTDTRTHAHTHTHTQSEIEDKHCSVQLLNLIHTPTQREKEGRHVEQFGFSVFNVQKIWQSLIVQVTDMMAVFAPLMEFTCCCCCCCCCWLADEAPSLADGRGMFCYFMSSSNPLACFDE